MMHLSPDPLLFTPLSAKPLAGSENHPTPSLSHEEEKMLAVINRIRKDPAAYRSVVLAGLSAVRADSARISLEVSEVITTRWEYHGDTAVIFSDTTYRDRYSELVAAYADLLDQLAHTPPLPPVEYHSELRAAASRHARDQASKQYIEHWDSQGRWPIDRLRAVAPWITAGNENIAAGPDDPEGIVLQLMVDAGVDGRGHRNNILDPNWRYVACYKVTEFADEDLAWWIQEFAY